MPAGSAIYGEHGCRNPIWTCFRGRAASYRWIHAFPSAVYSVEVGRKPLHVPSMAITSFLSDFVAMLFVILYLVFSSTVCLERIIGVVQIMRHGRRGLASELSCHPLLASARMHFRGGPKGSPHESVLSPDVVS
jgi:hypothetical protein